MQLISGATIDEAVEKAKLKLNDWQQSETAQRLELARETWQAPRLTISAALVIAVIGLAVAPLWGWHVKRERDAWWRSEIASHSTSVRHAVAAGNAEATATDDEIIKALGDDHAKLLAAETALKNASHAAADSCPVIPARCLGLR